MCYDGWWNEWLKMVGTTVNVVKSYFAFFQTLN